MQNKWVDLFNLFLNVNKIEVFHCDSGLFGLWNPIKWAPTVFNKLKGQSALVTTMNRYFSFVFFKICFVLFFFVILFIHLQIQQSLNLIDLCLQGMDYFYRYDEFQLQMFITFAYIGWAGILIVFIIQERITTSKKKKLVGNSS